MKPIDKRLALGVSSASAPLLAGVILGLVRGVLVVVQAFLLARLITSVFPGPTDLSDYKVQIMCLVLVMAARSVVTLIADKSSVLASANAKRELREHALDAIAHAKNPSVFEMSVGQLVSVVTHGIDTLENYYAKYLPKFVAGAVIPPIALLVILSEDPMSFAFYLITLPLVPVFMILIGRITESQMDKQSRKYNQLSGYFLDVVRGLATLKAYNVSKRQSKIVTEKTNDLRISTMANLKLAFLSGAVLDLLASIGVAIVAVSVGLRLIDGELDFTTGLTVLFLAPEVFTPIRQVSAEYHAASEGLAASNEIFYVIDKPLSNRKELAGSREETTIIKNIEKSLVSFENVSLKWPKQTEYVFKNISFDLRPNLINLIDGPSGIGKSSVAQLLMRFADPTSGLVKCNDLDIASVNLQSWRECISWVPQLPTLFEGSIEDNLLIASPEATEDEMKQAITNAGLTSLIENERGGLKTVLSERGSAISAGQRQRLAVARAFLKKSPIVVLDEPTAHLDRRSAIDVINGISEVLEQSTVVLMSHDDSLRAIAGNLIDLEKLIRQGNDSR